MQQNVTGRAYEARRAGIRATVDEEGEERERHSIGRERHNRQGSQPFFFIIKNLDYGSRCSRCSR